MRVHECSEMGEPGHRDKKSLGKKRNSGADSNWREVQNSKGKVGLRGSDWKFGSHPRRGSKRMLRWRLGGRTEGSDIKSLDFQTA